VKIKALIIEGVDGDVDIVRTDSGAHATVKRFTQARRHHDHIVADLRREDAGDVRYAKAAEVAKHIYGINGQGRADAADWMIHEVMTEMERVAGC
jgi:hypothetical protein